jgi:GINS complex subunit 4
MKQLLGQEKMSPELLPYQHLLVESMCKQISDKERRIQSQPLNKKQSSQDLKFYQNINQMEVERVKFILKSYLRARIIKIEKFLIYIVEKDKANLLSKAEMDYCWELYEMKKQHLNGEFFNKISKNLNMLADDKDVPDNISKSFTSFPLLIFM